MKFSRNTVALCLIASSMLAGCASQQKAWNESKVVTIPDCSVGFISQTQGNAYSNRFRNKGLVSATIVYTPFDDHKAVFQEIADESCQRFQKKLAALGYEIVDGTALAGKNEKFAKLQKEYYTSEPDSREQFTYFGSTRGGTPKGGAGWSVNMGYGSLGRNLEGVVLIPEFGITFGAVQTSGGSYSTGSSTTYETSAKFTPTVTADKNRSKIMWIRGDDIYHMNQSKDYADSSIPWLIDVDLKDSKTSTLSIIGNLMLGSRVEKASFYTMNVDAKAMKTSILAQLDKAENDYLDQIKKIKGITN